MNVNRLNKKIKFLLSFLSFICFFNSACTLSASISSDSAKVDSGVESPEGGGGNGSDSGGTPAKPLAVLNNLPSSLTNNSIYSLTVGGGDITGYYYKIGASSSTNCADPLGYSGLQNSLVPINGVLSSNDTYRVCVLGQNSSGVIQEKTTVTSFQWVFDNQAPTLNISSPANNSFVNSSTQTAVPIVSLCSEHTTNVEVTATVVSPAAVVTGTGNCNSGTVTVNLNLSSLADGDVHVVTKQTDAAGNIGTSPETILKKDVVSPSFTAGSLNDTTFFNSLTASPTLSWPSATDAISGIDHYELTIGTSSNGTDVANWADIGNVVSYTKSGLTLSGGTTYYPTVRPVDAAGNIGAPLSGDGWGIDTTVPTSPSSVTTGTTTSSLTQSPNTTWVAGSDANGISHYEMAIGTTAGGTDVVNWTNIGNVTSYTMTGLTLSENTNYYTTIRAVDVSGNPSTIASSATPWMKLDSCSDGSASTGNSCAGGALYAGVYNSATYMVTPGGCSDSTTPTCPGTTDTVTKMRNSGYALAYCSDMVYGGYSDWFLPSSAELVFIATNSASFGGFQNVYYYTSDNGSASGMSYFVNGQTAATWSNNDDGYPSRPVRCVRKHLQAPTALIAGNYSFLTQGPNLTWTNPPASGGAAVTSFEAQVVKVSDSSVVKSWSTITNGGSLSDLSLIDTISYRYQLRAVDANGVKWNYASSSSWTASDGDCSSPSLGKVCTGGVIYAGTYSSMNYLVTPGGCSDSTTPTCPGTTDTVTKMRNSGYALAYCSDMVYGGYSDWFLPSSAEMTYIATNSASFGGFISDYYYTSDNGSGPGMSYVVNGQTAYNWSNNDDGYPSRYVRCVRKY